MKNKGFRKALSCLLCLGLLLSGGAGSYGAETIDSGVRATYDEAYYGNLDYYGNLLDGSIVKSYILNGTKSITDYGTYDAVNNLTDSTEPQTSGDKTVFDLGEDTELSHFYFEAKTDQPFRDLPWSIVVRYKLNGVPVEAQELAGKTGMVEIDISATPNPNIDDYVKNNYTLEIISVFNQDHILSLNAPGAQVQLIGNLRAVLFMALPGEECEYSISVGAEDFTFGGLTIMMIPGTLGQLEMLGDLADKKEDIEDNYHKLDRSLDTLLDSVEDMSGSLNAAAEGLDELNEARGIISEEKGGLYESADQTLENLEALNGSLDALQGDIAKGKEATEEMTEDLQGLNARLAALSRALNRVQSSLDDLEDDLDKINKSASSGSGSLQSNVTKLGNDAEALETALEGLLDELAVLQLQIDGTNDLTIAGVPSDQLAAASAQGRALAENYRSAVSYLGGTKLADADAFKMAAYMYSNDCSAADAAAALQAQQTALNNVIAQLISGSGGSITTPAQAIAYMYTQPATYGAITAAIDQSTLMDNLYGATAGAGGQSLEDFFTAMLMAQAIQGGAAPATVIGAAGSYRTNARDSLQLLNVLENGLTARLAALSDTLGNTRDDGAAGLSGALSDLITQTGNASRDLADLSDDAGDAMDDLKAVTNELQTLSSHVVDRKEDILTLLDHTGTALNALTETTTSAHALFVQVEDVAKRAGEKLDSGTQKSLESLASVLRQTAKSVGSTRDIRSAKKGISEVIEDVWNDYTGDVNNMLLIDPNAPIQSLTDSRNDSPSSVQILLRTQEIVADEDTPEEAEEAESAEPETFWQRVAQMFKDFGNWIRNLFS